MKQNKKPNKKPDLTQLIVDFGEEFDGFQVQMSSLSERDILMACMRMYPGQVHTGSHEWLDSTSRKFPVKVIQDNLQSLGIANWAGEQFHEMEMPDRDALEDFITELPPTSKTSLKEVCIWLASYLDQRYPDPVDTVFSSFNGYTMQQKDYFLPAAKMLHQDNRGVFWSPMYAVEWENDELVAYHLHSSDFLPVKTEPHPEEAQFMESCTCGIYGSVNMEELQSYLVRSRKIMGLDLRFRPDERRLCIIEPYSDSTVYLARKGWKASKAFISEVVGTTISVEDASRLLSMVWQRPIDLSTLYTSKE